MIKVFGRCVSSEARVDMCHSNPKRERASNSSSSSNSNVVFFWDEPCVVDPLILSKMAPGWHSANLIPRNHGSLRACFLTPRADMTPAWTGSRSARYLGDCRILGQSQMSQMLVLKIACSLQHKTR